MPETALAPGQVGIVCSEWAGCDEPVFEVEFIAPTHGDLQYDDVTRRLLKLEQIALLEQLSGEREPMPEDAVPSAV